MSRIPCRQCKSCGLFNDFTVGTCECGVDLFQVPIIVIEEDNIPLAKIGSIAEDLSVYVQKCSACGALNFTPDKNKRVKVCYNCHKARVASIEPIAFIDDEDSVEEEPTDCSGSSGGRTPVTNTEKKPAAEIRLNGYDDDDDDDDDDDATSSWAARLGNIRKTVGSDESVVFPPKTTVPTNQNAFAGTDEDDDEEDDDETDWSGVLGASAQPKPSRPQTPKHEITLTAIRYGRLSFSIAADENVQYMLGRSAKQSSFLVQDGRVGNEHCIISFRKGHWYVKDNHSANGTAVNCRDIGEDGEQELFDGDELKLGHHQDSMAFRITII